MTRNEETKLVKNALAKAGINAVVGHGHGTAWGWLHINVGSSEQFAGHTHEADGSHRNCVPCQKINAIAQKAESIAQEVTGRHGEYGGCINVYTQKEWNKKLNTSVEIVQPS